MQTAPTTTRSARIAFLATPQFKAQLQALAREENVSVGSLIRARFEQPDRAPQDEEERLLRVLTAELHAAVADARESLEAGLAAARSALQGMQAAREEHVRETV